MKRILACELPAEKQEKLYGVMRQQWESCPWKALSAWILEVSDYLRENMGLGVSLDLLLCAFRGEDSRLSFEGDPEIVRKRIANYLDSVMLDLEHQK